MSVRASASEGECPVERNDGDEEEVTDEKDCREGCEGGVGEGSANGQDRRRRGKAEEADDGGAEVLRVEQSGCGTLFKEAGEVETDQAGDVMEIQRTAISAVGQVGKVMTPTGSRRACRMER
jgi:hypothetical protein